MEPRDEAQAAYAAQPAALHIAAMRLAKRVTGEGDDALRGGSVCLNSLAGLLSGLPTGDHAAARSGWLKYTSSGVLQPRLECGRPLL